jgi:SCP-2 sterol transfer family
MTDPTAEFFDELGRRGHDPLLENATGTLRFDVADGKRIARWFVTIRKGDVTVSRENRAADSVVRVDRALFDRAVKGKANAMAALLRGAIRIEGEPELLVLFQRLFPGPPRSRNRPRPGGHARRER